LDFVNDREEILASFQPFYEDTTISEDVDPQQLYDISSKLDKYQVYHKEEIEAFCAVFFKPKIRQSPQDHKTMNSIIDPSVERFKGLTEKDQESMKKLMVTYRSLYSFLSQVIPFYDSDLEKLYAYVRMFLSKLPREPRDTMFSVDDEVALKYYRLEKQSEGAITLKEDERGEVSGPVEVGSAGKKDATAALSEIIEVLNERFGTDFKPADQLFLDSIKETAKSREDIREKAMANSEENFGLVFSKALEGFFIERMEQNESIFNRYMGDTKFKKAVDELMTRKVYKEIREEPEQGTE